MNKPVRTNEKKDRNNQILNDYAQGMIMIDLVSKYRITSKRIYEIIARAKKELV